MLSNEKIGIPRKCTFHKISSERKILFGVLLLFSGMILSLCFQDTINYDEYFSMQWCRLNWGELMRTLIADVHPPLYYLLLKPIFDLTNGNMVCARLLSAVFGIALLWAGSLFLSRNFGTKPALFYACFLYLNPFMIQKTTEIRMYMPASFFTVMSGIFFYYICKEPQRKYWVYFTISSLCAAYTHYYALLVMCFLYAGLALYVIFRGGRQRISWLICVLCTAAGYLPWLPVAWKQVTAVNGAYWIEAPTSRLAPLRELFYSVVPGSEHIYLGVIGLLVLLTCLQMVRTKRVSHYWTLTCCSALCGIMLFTMWYASQIRPILVSRYLIMAMCLCILGISGTVRYLHKYLVVVICVFCCLIGGLRYHALLCAQADRITTRTVAYINENGSTDDCIVFVNDGYGYLAHCVEYYFPDMRHVCIEPENLAELSVIPQETNGSVWFMDDSGYLNDTGNISGDFQPEDCGHYGFGASDFVLYCFRSR